MVLTWFYPITRQKHEAVRAELAARKETDTTDE
jgi:Na+/melibiose symporter-like transporter